jgi:hypothetical protein
MLLAIIKSPNGSAGTELLISKKNSWFFNCENFWQLFSTTIYLHKTFLSFQLKRKLDFHPIQHYLRYKYMKHFISFFFRSVTEEMKKFKDAAFLYTMLCLFFTFIKQNEVRYSYTFYQFYLFFSLDVPSDSRNDFQLLSEWKWWHRCFFRWSIFLPLVFPKDLAWLSLITAAI